jgi:hypothetical protein
MIQTLPFFSLAFSVIGAVLVWLLSPGHLSVNDGGTFEQNTDRIQAITKRKNIWLKVGLVMVVVGAAGQVVVFLEGHC